MTKHTQPRALRSSAVSLAIAGMLMAGSVYAGKIDNTNNTAGKLGACGADDTATTACVGAWNLGNVDVTLTRAEDGAPSGKTFDPATGNYATMTIGDSFASMVKDLAGKVMARLTGKDWPVGEPTGIKAVNGDSKVSNGKPENCLINTSYLGANDSSTRLDTYLDSTAPEPVICSSGFQSHKRFKVAMLASTVANTANGEAGEGIDLVFNVTDNGSLTPYQVFSKINNYTDKRLGGYKIVVGRGLGAEFRSAGDLGIADKLHLSLGLGEGGSKSQGEVTLDGSDLFDGDGLATFSHGLFGTADKNFDTNGFFDTRTAGFTVDQACSEFETKAECTNYPNPYATIDPTAVPLLNSDTIYSTGLLASNYSTLFGDWLPSKWQPSGIFHDDDNDPTTDAVLKAWWNGSAWVQNNDSGSAPVTEEQFAAWTADPLYAVSKIEDVLNLGINYIVKVGDDIDGDGNPATGDFTIRIIPVVADNQDEPSFLGTEPTPLEPAPVLPVDPVAPTSDGGGCSAATSQRPVDPVLPLLAALGLVGWGLRRARRH
jgi:hypothetical protein